MLALTSPKVLSRYKHVGLYAISYQLSTKLKGAYFGFRIVEGLGIEVREPRYVGESQLIWDILFGLFVFAAEMVCPLYEIHVTVPTGIKRSPFYKKYYLAKDCTEAGCCSKLHLPYSCNVHQMNLDTSNACLAWHEKRVTPPFLETQINKADPKFNEAGLLRAIKKVSEMGVRDEQGVMDHPSFQWVPDDETIGDGEQSFLL